MKSDIETPSKQRSKTIRRRKSRKATGRMARYVRELRTRLELTQPEFGKIFQSAAITVSRWEGAGKVQDPPRPILKRLALVAGNMGYRDLEMIFSAGESYEEIIDGRDRSIISLLACLMRWKHVTEDNTNNVFDVGREIYGLAHQTLVDAGNTQRPKNLVRDALLAEMARLVEEIYNSEHRIPNPLTPSINSAAALHALGVPMYSNQESTSAPSIKETSK